MTENDRGSNDDRHEGTPEDDAQRWDSSLGDSSLNDTSLNETSLDDNQGGTAGAHGSHPYPGPSEEAEQSPFSREAWGPGQTSGEDAAPAPDSHGAPQGSYGSAPDPHHGGQGYPPQPGYPASSPGSAPQPDPGAGQAWPGYPGQAGGHDQGYGSAGGYGGAQGYGSPQAQPDQGYGQQPPPYGTPPESSGYGAPYDPTGYGANPYDANPYSPAVGGYAPYGVAPVNHPQSTPALILGIVGLAVCPLTGPAALVLGNKARKGIDAEPQRYSGRGMATAGVVLGILGSLYLVLVVLLVILGLSGSLE